MSNSDDAPRRAYSDTCAAALTEAAACERSARALGLLRLFTFFLTVLLLIAAFDGWPRGVPVPLLWGLFVLALGSFVALVLRHDAVLRRLERARHRIEVNRRGLRRLDGEWTREPLIPPPPSSEPPPPYAADLDVLGPGSLIQLCDTTGTRYGERALRRHLSRAAEPTPDVTEAMAVQAAVRELAPLLAVRQALEIGGRLLGAGSPGVQGGRKPDPEPFVRWAESAPEILGQAVLRAAAFLPILTVPVFVAQLVRPMHELGIALLALLGAQTLALLLTLRPIGKLVDSVAAREHAVGPYAEMLTVLGEAELTAPANRALLDRVSPAGRPAAQHLSRLRDLCGYLELRRHPLLWLPLNALFLWDLHFALRVERWQREIGPSVRGWLDALGEAEARASLATLAFDNPDWAWPEIVAGPPQLEADGLGHPLLPAARRVGNDVVMPGPGRAFLVTGSNMSGKSTLLRSIGLLQVMAHAGAPVCARRARLSPMRLRTVVRIDDSVLGGVSHFYAELKRLKETLDAAHAAAQSPPAVCYLLDEILHGTNTRERELGARLCIRTLCRLGAMGAVSTHDLSLSSLEAESGGAVVNIHFTEKVEGDRMTFDYQLRTGPVQTTNALRLMRMCGLGLDWAVEPGAAEASRLETP